MNPYATFLVGASILLLLLLYVGTAVHKTKRFTDTLATLLNNPLRNPMKILSESSVSSAYGQTSIDQGKWVGIAALLITTGFMLFIYRLAGIVAIIGLLINMAILFGAMSLFGFTLTMPGIAGLVLTIGMAVDANVLIYERLREEMEAGKTLAAALDAAYEKAFSAIADSNDAEAGSDAGFLGMTKVLKRGAYFSASDFPSKRIRARYALKRLK